MLNDISQVASKLCNFIVLETLAGTDADVLRKVKQTAGQTEWFAKLGSSLVGIEVSPVSVLNETRDHRFGKQF